MTTKTDICNEAMVLLGEKRLLDYETDTTERAQAARTIFDSTVRELLQYHNWNFATTIEALAELDGYSYPGVDYVYLYPSNALQILRITDSTNSGTMYNHKEIAIQEINGKGILTDLEEAYCEYVIDIQDPELYSPLFASCLKYLLASKIALTLTGDPNKQVSNYNLFLGLLSTAKLKNAQESREKPTETSSFISCRG